MSKEEQDNTITNTIGAMSSIRGPKKEKIIFRQLCQWFRMDEEFGARLAKCLNVDIYAAMDIVGPMH